MPIITVTLGKTDAQVKTDLIRDLTKTAVDTTKIPAPHFTILIHELDDNNIGIGGKTLGEVKQGK